MISQIWNRLQLIVAQGRGLLVGKYKIQVSVLDGETLNNIDRIESYGLSTLPLEGCQAYIVFPSGDRSHGLCLIQGDKRYQIDLQKGEVALHDDLGQKIHLTRNGIVFDGAGQPMTFTNTPKVRFDTPLIEGTGEIKDKCDTTGRTMSDIRAIYDGHNHGGDSGGVTTPPIQGMG